ncbi:MAG: DMT family transporter [Clostridiaceae bacterium]
MNRLGEILSLLAATSWSVNSLVMEKYGQKLTPMATNFARLLLGLLGTTLILLFLKNPIIPVDVSSRVWIALLISGLIGFAIGDTFLVAAIKSIGARVTFLIYSLSPVLAGILGYFVFGEKMSYMAILGTAIIILGVIIVVLKSEGKSVKLNYSLKGVIDASVATLGQSFGVILSKYGVSNLDAFSATQIRLIGGFLGILAIMIIKNLWSELKPLRNDRQSQLVSLSTGTLGTVIGVALSMQALKYTQAAIASVLMATMPVIIIIISIVFLKEKIKPREIIGAILTVIGIAILFI